MKPMKALPLIWLGAGLAALLYSTQNHIPLENDPGVPQFIEEINEFLMT